MFDISLLLVDINSCKTAISVKSIFIRVPEARPSNTELLFGFTFILEIGESTPKLATDTIFSYPSSSSSCLTSNTCMVLSSPPDKSNSSLYQSMHVIVYLEWEFIDANISMVFSLSSSFSRSVSI